MNKKNLIDDLEKDFKNSLKEELEDAFSHLNPPVPIDNINGAGIANVQTDDGLKKNVFVVGKDSVANTILLFDPKGSSNHKEFIHDHPHVTYFVNNIKGVNFAKEEGSFIFSQPKFVKDFKSAQVTYNSNTKTFTANSPDSKSKIEKPKFSMKDFNESGYVSYRLSDGKLYTGGILLGASDRYLLIHGKNDFPSSHKSANYNPVLNNSLNLKEKFVDFPDNIPSTMKDGGFMWLSPENIEYFVPTTITCAKDKIKFTAHPDKVEMNESSTIDYTSGVVSYELNGVKHGGILLASDVHSNSEFVLIFGTNPQGLAKTYNAIPRESTKFVNFPGDMSSNNPRKGFFWLNVKDITDFKPANISYRENKNDFLVNDNILPEPIKYDESGLVDLLTDRLHFNSIIVGKSLTEDKLLIYSSEFTDKKLPEKNIKYYVKNLVNDHKKYKHGGFKLISPKNLHNFRPKLISFLPDKSEFEIREKYSFKDINEAGLVDFQRLYQPHHTNGYLIGKSDETGNFLIYHESFCKKSLPLSGHYTYYVNIPTHPTKFSNGGFVEIKPQEILNFTPKIVTCADDSYTFKYRSKYKLEEINSTGHVEYELDGVNYTGYLLGKDNDSVFILGRNDTYGSKQYVGNSFKVIDDSKIFTNIPTGIDVANEKFRFFWLLFDNVRLFSPEKLTCELTKDSKLDIVRHFTPVESTEKGNYKFDDINSTGHLGYRIDGKKYTNGLLLGKDRNTQKFLVWGPPYGHNGFNLLFKENSKWAKKNLFLELPTDILTEDGGSTCQWHWISLDEIIDYSPTIVTYKINKNNKLEFVYDSLIGKDKENKMTDIKDKVLGSPKEDLKKAGIAIATNTFLSTIKGPLADSIAASMPSVSKEQALSFLNSPIGEAFVGYFMAAAINMVPLKQFESQRSEIAEHLRIKAYTDVGNSAVEIVAEPLMQALQSASVMGLLSSAEPNENVVDTTITQETTESNQQASTP